MATLSQPATALGQPQHQGPSTPVGEAITHLGSTTLDDICNLLQCLGTAISKLTARVAENKEITKDVRSTVKNVSQQVNYIAGTLQKPNLLGSTQ
jgi:hypothetical protein